MAFIFISKPRLAFLTDISMRERRTKIDLSIPKHRKAFIGIIILIGNIKSIKYVFHYLFLISNRNYIIDQPAPMFNLSYFTSNFKPFNGSHIHI